nr:hypothetical protein [Tanacetum cinerariifolium]
FVLKLLFVQPRRIRNLRLTRILLMNHKRKSWTGGSSEGLEAGDEWTTGGGTLVEAHLEVSPGETS